MADPCTSWYGRHMYQLVWQTNVPADMASFLKETFVGDAVIDNERSVLLVEFSDDRRPVSWLEAPTTDYDSRTWITFKTLMFVDDHGKKLDHFYRVNVVLHHLTVQRILLII